MVSSYSLPFTIQPSDDILLFIFNNIWLSLSQGFCHSSVCKESDLQCRPPQFNSQVGKILWRRKWQPAPVFTLGESHGQRSLAVRSPCDGKSRTQLRDQTTAITSFLILSIFFPMPLLDVSNLYNYLFPTYLYSIIFFIQPFPIQTKLGLFGNCHYYSSYLSFISSSNWATREVHIFFHPCPIPLFIPEHPSDLIIVCESEIHYMIHAEYFFSTLVFPSYNIFYNLIVFCHFRWTVRW